MEKRYTYRGRKYTKKEISGLIKDIEPAWSCNKCGKDAYNCECYECSECSEIKEDCVCLEPVLNKLDYEGKL